MTVLRETGIRIEEAVELTISDLQTTPDGDRLIPVVHVRPSKLDKARLVVSSPQLLGVLDSYVHRVTAHYGRFPDSARRDVHEDIQHEPERHLFFTYHYRQFTGITPETARSWLKPLAAYYDEHLNPSAIKFGTLRPHGLRRAFAGPSPPTFTTGAPASPRSRTNWGTPVFTPPTST